MMAVHLLGVAAAAVDVFTTKRSAVRTLLLPVPVCCSAHTALYCWPEYVACHTPT